MSDLTCRVYSRWFPDEPCGEPATVTGRSGCVHEHVWNTAVCEHHATVTLYCETCYALDQHRCPAPMTRMGTLA
jgi:hypothetical protein